MLLGLVPAQRSPCRPAIEQPPRRHPAGADIRSASPYVSVMASSPPNAQSSIIFMRFDPTHEHEDEVFTRFGYIDVQHLADRITGKVQMTTALMDMICPPSTQFAAYNKIRAQKEMVLYPDFGHDDLPGQHDRLFDFLSGPET
jgi:cephalosporin-C deacetylase-like acetyl esterase